MKLKSLKKLTKRLGKGTFTVQDVITVISTMAPNPVTCYAILKEKDGHYHDELGYGFIYQGSRFEVPQDKTQLRVGSTIMYPSKTGMSPGDHAVRVIPEVRSLIKKFCAGAELYSTRAGHVAELLTLQRKMAHDELIRRKVFADASSRESTETTITD